MGEDKTGVYLAFTKKEKRGQEEWGGGAKASVHPLAHSHALRFLCKRVQNSSLNTHTPAVTIHAWVYYMKLQRLFCPGAFCIILSHAG